MSNPIILFMNLFLFSQIRQNVSHIAVTMVIIDKPVKSLTRIKWTIHNEYF